MAMMKIMLQLAETAEFPGGSAAHGYAFFAPMTDSGHIDIEEWDEIGEECDVVRFWGVQAVETGILRHTEQGWRFDCGRGKGASVFTLNHGNFLRGGHVVMTDGAGDRKPFRVVSVVPVSNPSGWYETVQYPLQPISSGRMDNAASRSAGR